MSTLDHHRVDVQVWDGKAYSLVPMKEAKRLAKQGTHQITTNLSASQLKRPEEFKPKKVANKSTVPETAGKSWEK